MGSKKKILLILIVIIAGAAWYGYRQYNRKNIDLANTRPDMEISGANLIDSFEANEKLANEKYLDKIIAVRGRLKEINRDEKGFYTVVIGEENSMSTVRCSMDSAHQQDIPLMKTGNPIRIKGVCTGFNADELLGSDVILNRAVISDRD